MYEITMKSVQHTWTIVSTGTLEDSTVIPRKKEIVRYTTTWTQTLEAGKPSLLFPRKVMNMNLVNMLSTVAISCGPEINGVSDQVIGYGKIISVSTTAGSANADNTTRNCERWNNLKALPDAVTAAKRTIS